MILKESAVKFATKAGPHLVNITHQLKEIVKDSDVEEGLANLFVPGATGAVIAIEWEKGLIEDFRQFLEKIIPAGLSYLHNETHSDANGHSHIRASLLGPSLTLPIRKGMVVLGTWQNIVFVELDNRPRQRTVLVTVLGHGRTS